MKITNVEVSAHAKNDKPGNIIRKKNKVQADRGLIIKDHKKETFLRIVDGLCFPIEHFGKTAKIITVYPSEEEDYYFRNDRYEIIENLDQDSISQES